MITTQFFDHINRTPALSLAIQGQAELLEAGLSEPITLVGWDNMAIVAFDVDGEAVGVITFAEAKWANQFDIAIGWVKPSARDCGVYRAMWDELVRVAQTKAVAVIWGNTHVENAQLRAVAKSLGRTETGVIMKFDVPPAEGNRP